MRLRFFNSDAKKVIIRTPIEEGAYYQCKDTGTLYYGSTDKLIPTSPISVDENSDGTGLRSVNSGNNAIGIRSIIAGSNNSTTNGTNSAVFASNISAINDVNKNTGIFASSNSAIYNKSAEQIEQVAIIASVSSNFESGYAHSDFSTKNSLIAATSGSKVSGTNSAIIGGRGNSITDSNNVVILGGNAIKATEDNFVYLNNLAFVRSDSSGNQFITKLLNPDGVNQDTTLNLPKTSGTLMVSGDVSFSPSLTEGTAIGSLSINGTTTDLYTPNLTIEDTLESGTKIGTITFGDTATDLNVDLTNYLDKTYTGVNNLAGTITIGDKDSNMTEAFMHIRNVGDKSLTGYAVNGLCATVNASGYPSIEHKVYNEDGTIVKDAEVLRLTNKGLQYAVNTGSSKQPSESMFNTVLTSATSVTAMKDANKYLNKTTTQVNQCAGSIQVGNYDKDTYNAFLHIRNCKLGADPSQIITDHSIVGVCLSVNADGTASFLYKTYDDTKGSNPRNAAVFRFSNLGVQFAINTGSGKIPTEDMYKRILTEEDLPDLTSVASLQSDINKLKAALVSLGVDPDTL